MPESVVGYASVAVRGKEHRYSGARRTEAEATAWAKSHGDDWQIGVWPLVPLPPAQIAAYERLAQPLPHWQNWPPVNEKPEGETHNAQD